MLRFCFVKTDIYICCHQCTCACVCVSVCVCQCVCMHVCVCMCLCQCVCVYWHNTCRRKPNLKAMLRFCFVKTLHLHQSSVCMCSLCVYTGTILVGGAYNFKAMLRLCLSKLTSTSVISVHVCVYVCVCVCTGTILVGGAYNFKAMLRFLFVKTDIYIGHQCTCAWVCVSVLSKLTSASVVACVCVVCVCGVCVCGVCRV